MTGSSAPVKASLRNHPYSHTIALTETSPGYQRAYHHKQSTCKQAFKSRWCSSYIRCYCILAIFEATCSTHSMRFSWVTECIMPTLSTSPSSNKCSLRVCLATELVVSNSDTFFRQRSPRQRLPDRYPRWNLFEHSTSETVRTRMRDAFAICPQPIRICFVRDLCGSNPALQYSPQLLVSDALTQVYV